MTVTLSGWIDNGVYASTLCSQGSFFDFELNSELFDRAGESYTTKQRRIDASQAGLRAGSFFLVPRGVSQAAVSDENLYQVMANDRGVLPLQTTWTVSPRLNDFYKHLVYINCLFIHF